MNPDFQLHLIFQSIFNGPLDLAGLPGEDMKDEFAKPEKLQ